MNNSYKGILAMYAYRFYEFDKRIEESGKPASSSKRNAMSTQTYKNNMFGEIHAVIDRESEIVKLVWDQQDGPGSMDSCLHKVVPFTTPAQGLAKGSVLSVHLSDQAILRVTITKATKSEMSGTAEFHITLTDEDLVDGNCYFCPVCGDGEPFMAFPPVVMKMDGKGKYSRLGDEEAELDFCEDESNEVHCEICKFQGTKLFFHLAAWEIVKP